MPSESTPESSDQSSDALPATGLARPANSSAGEPQDLTHPGGSLLRGGSEDLTFTPPQASNAPETDNLAN